MIDYSRYIKASVVNHFMTRSQGIDLFVQEQVKRASEEYFELHLTDMSVEEVARGQHKIDLNIAVICSTSFDVGDTYRIDDLVGIIRSAYIDIQIYMYGGGNSYLGCLQQRGGVQVNYFGRGKKDNAPVTAILEGGYTSMLVNQ